MPNSFRAIYLCVGCIGDETVLDLEDLKELKDFLHVFPQDIRSHWLFVKEVLTGSRFDELRDNHCEDEFFENVFGAVGAVVWNDLQFISDLISLELYGLAQFIFDVIPK